MAGPGDETATAQSCGRGRLRASGAGREQVIGILKAAFVQGMLARPSPSRTHSAVPRLMFRRIVHSKSGIGPNNGATSRASFSQDATSSGVPSLTVLTRTA